jgi:hypothetical protein
MDEYVNVMRPLEALQAISAFRMFMVAMLVRKMSAVLPKHVCVIIHRYFDGLYTHHRIQQHIREENHEFIPKIVPAVKSVAFAIPIMFTSTEFVTKYFRSMLHFLTERMYYNETIFINVNNISPNNPRLDSDLRRRIAWQSSNVADLFEKLSEAIETFKEIKDMYALESPLEHTCWVRNAPQGDHPSLIRDDYDSDDQCYVCYVLMLEIIHAFVEKFHFTYRFNLQESLASYMAARRLLSNGVLAFSGFKNTLPIVEEIDKEVHFRYFGGKRVAQHVDENNQTLFDKMVRDEEAKRSINRRRRLIAPLPQSSNKRTKTEGDEENIDDVDLICEETLDDNNNNNICPSF